MRKLFSLAALGLLAVGAMLATPSPSDAQVYIGRGFYGPGVSVYAGPRYYRPYYGYRSYYDYGYGYGYRPYARSYYYGGYGYRPYARSYYYDYGYRPAYRSYYYSPYGGYDAYYSPRYYRPAYRYSYYW